MVASMFNHPLSHEGLSFQKLLEQPDGSISLPSVAESGPESMRESGPDKKAYINVLGTGDSLKRGAVRDMYADMLNMSTTDPRLYDVMSSTAAQWMLSNPSPRFKRIYQDFKTDKLSQCSSGHFDFGIQIRSWVDWVSYYSFFEKNKPCIIDCIESVIVNFIETKISSSDEHRPCIFLTSDSGPDAADIIDKLKQRFQALTPALSVDFVVSALPQLIKGEIEDRAAYQTKIRSVNDKPFSWRSDFVLRSTRNEFNINDLMKRTDLLDWMLLGDVDAAIYTGASTFGRSARMRGGYSAQRNDHVVTTRPSAGGGGGGCVCQAVQPEDYSGVTFNGLGVMVV
jgi:hypothetical protein